MPSEPDWLSAESDETVVWVGEPRIWRIWPTVALAALVAAGAVGGAAYVTIEASDGARSTLTPLAWGGAALAVAVLAVSTSAILVRWSEAPAVVAAFYRVLFTTLLLAPLGLVRYRESLASTALPCYSPRRASRCATCDDRCK
jgi:hypothetical protein